MKAALTDTMMFKPLAFEYTDARSKEVEDQLLFGNELMLTPVYTQNTTGRFVYLPEEMMQSSASIQAGDDYQLIGYEKASYELYEDDGIRKSEGNLKKYIRILLKN